ncbi:MAG: hypothetical protein ABFQ82_05995 [Thermodesulfobacteriota bacterium]
MSDDIATFEGQNKQVKEELQKASEDGGIQCAAALGIAKKLGVTPKEVGEVANHLNIKIRKCQLGCF